jgi:hypothetical protein
MGGFAGGGPAAKYFLLYAQKKVLKEKGTQMSHPSDSLRFTQPIHGLRLKAAFGCANWLSCQFVSVSRGLADSTYMYTSCFATVSSNKSNLD